MSDIIENVLVRSEHVYTRSSEPWQLDADVSDVPVVQGGRRFGRRLFHYLSGGGSKAFGRSVAREAADRRQNRFFVAFALGAVVWLLLWCL